MKILLTGAAGFIGYHLAHRLAKDPTLEILGLDNLNDYYDPGLKVGRLRDLGFEAASLEPGVPKHSSKWKNLRFVKGALEDRPLVDRLFEEEGFSIVINLAAQAGVRYSLENPYPYVETNILGFLNLLEGARNHKIKHFIYASSSSVYGLNDTMPFATHHAVDHPVSLYAATKRSNELMAHTYSHLYDLPTTGLRFFTVYGPFGRPDMAYFIFTKRIMEGQSIKVFNQGNMKRDFTYVDDITEAIYRLLEKTPARTAISNGEINQPNLSSAPFSIYNIGNNNPVRLMRFIEIIEETLGIEADKEFLPIQPGDVEATFADIDDLKELVGFNPSTPLEVGLPKFINWYREYYG